MSDVNPYQAPPSTADGGTQSPKQAPRWLAIVVALVARFPGVGLLMLGRVKLARLWLAAGGVAYLLFALQLSPTVAAVGLALFLLLWLASVVATFLAEPGPVPFGMPAWAAALSLVAALFGLTLGTRAFLCEAFQMPSGSMIPSLMIGDHIFVRKWQKTPRRGDVIVFEYPLDRRTDYVKRVVALPGETITIRGGEVIVDGRVLDRREVEEPCPYERGAEHCQVFEESTGDRSYRVLHTGRGASNFDPMKVPPGHYFVMGDNRDNSNDSRVWGPVPAANVKGVAAMIWWSRDPERGTMHWDRIGQPVR